MTMDPSVMSTHSGLHTVTFAFAVRLSCSFTLYWWNQVAILSDEVLHWASASLCAGTMHLKISQETGPCLIFIVISNIGYLASYGVFRGGGVNCELSVMIFDNVKVVSYYLCHSPLWGNDIMPKWNCFFCKTLVLTS